MSAKKTVKEVTKTQRKHSRQSIADQIDHLLGKYKNGTDPKKYEKNLKKASKVLSKVVVLPVTKRVNGGAKPATTTLTAAAK